MHGPIKVKSPNNTSKWQTGFNSAFKGLTKVHLSTTFGHICLSTFRPYGGTLHWKMTPVALACICIVRIIWEIYLTFVYSLNWTHYTIHANASNLFPCFCNILVMCLFIWKQIGFVITKTPPNFLLSALRHDDTIKGFVGSEGPSTKPPFLLSESSSSLTFSWLVHQNPLILLCNSFL